MKTYEINMTKGNLKLDLLKFSIPLAFTNVLQVVFNLVDVAVVGKFVGPNALGSVGSTTILITLFTGLVMGLGSGENVIVALYRGQDDANKIHRSVHTGFLICLIAGISIGILGVIFTPTILQAMSTKSELIQDAILYLRIYLLGLPALALYNYGTAILNAIGDTKHPLYYLLFSGILNLILNIFFVVVCHLSVSGVAIASIISQYISCFLVLHLLIKTKENYRLHLNKLTIDFTIAKKLLSIGVPASLQFAIFAFANLFVQIGVNSFSATVVSGTAAAANADNIVYDMMNAFYTGGASFISQNYGANNKERVKQAYIYSCAYAFIFALCIGLFLFFKGEVFLSLFTNSPDVIEAGMYRLKIMGLSYCISALMDAPLAASRGLGYTIWPVCFVILGSCIFRFIWIYTIFAYFKTITSLYLLYVNSWILTAILENIYFVKIYKKTFVE